jgi:hypothetical protein
MLTTAMLKSCPPENIIRELGYVPMQELDEGVERSNGVDPESTADGTDACAERKLLPPLLEPILAGIMDVLKSKKNDSKRRDAFWSLARSALHMHSACWALPSCIAITDVTDCLAVCSEQLTPMNH